MAQSIILKRSSQNGKTPTTASLNLGELAVNTYDGKVFLKKSGSVESIQTLVTTDSITTGSISLTGDLTVLGAVNAKQFNINVISSSVLYQSGSSKFGDTMDDVMGVTGSLQITGSLTINGTSYTAATSGTSGAQGRQGPQGNQGTQGTQGFQGNQGPQGNQGTQGTQGFQGTQGRQGPQGNQGTQGTQGFQGNQGPQGNQGTQGNQGPQGNQGTQGTQGNQGANGTSGTSVAVSGTTNDIVKFTSATTVGDSNITDNGTTISLGSNTVVTGSMNIVGNLSTNNLTLLNPGVGVNTQINFAKTNDTAQINVLEKTADNTMFEFKMTDNPDGGDVFHWVFGDWQSNSSGWKPLKFSGLTSQIVARTSNFWSSFNIPTSTPYYTTNADTADNYITKFDPYTSNSYNLIKDTGSGTGTLNVDVSSYSLTNSTTVYVVEIEAGATTFKWGNTGLALTNTGVAITGGSFQTLSNGVQIKLSSSGHVAGDKWSFRAFSTPRFAIGKTSATAPFDMVGNALITGSLNVTGSLTINGTSYTAATSGTSGAQGTQGFQGNQGTQGPQGNQGTQGTQGFQGNQGPQGNQGTQGTQGTQGFQGTQGNQGANGTSGTSVAVSGTTNDIVKFTSSTTVGDSNITDTGTLITLGSNTNISSGALGIGGTTFTGFNGGNLFIGKAITGNTNSNGVGLTSTINSDVTGAAVGYRSELSTQATTFTVGSIRHYQATQGTIGAGSTVNSQYGFWTSGLTGAANNYGFFGDIASGSGRWNLYMNGTANNYMAGALGIGSTTLTQYSLRVSKTITGAADSVGIFQNGAVQSDVTGSALGFTNQLNTQAAAFTLGTYRHFSAIQNSIGAGSTVTSQIGYLADSGLTGATNNYGFFGSIPAGTSRWNLHMGGTANNYLAGNLGIGSGKSVPTVALDVNGSALITGSLNVTGLVSASTFTGVGNLTDFSSSLDARLVTASNLTSNSPTTFDFDLVQAGSYDFDAPTEVRGVINFVTNNSGSVKIIANPSTADVLINDTSYLNVSTSSISSSLPISASAFVAIGSISASTFTGVGNLTNFSSSLDARINSMSISNPALPITASAFLGESITLSSSATSSINLNIGSTTYGYINAINGIGITISSKESKPLMLLTNNIERIRILNTGELLAGRTTIPYTATGLNQISVYGSGRGAFTMSYGSSSSVGAMWYGSEQIDIYNSSTTGGIKVMASSAGVILNVNGSSWSSASDIRIKTNLIPIENALNKIVSLRAMTGRYTHDADGTSRSFLIAQDVQSVLPEAVSINQETGYLNLSYTDVIPLLVASIKELTEEINKIKQQII